MLTLVQITLLNGYRGDFSRLSPSDQYMWTVSRRSMHPSVLNITHMLY